MTIFELLTRDHRQLDMRFREVHAFMVDGQLEAAHEAFQALSVTLLGSMRAEHAVVYPRFAFVGLREEVTQALREHDQIEQTVNHIRLAGLPAAEWQRSVELLERQIRAHVEAEETVLFPFARWALSDQDALDLAAEFEGYQPFAASVSGPSITYQMVG